MEDKSTEETPDTHRGYIYAEKSAVAEERVEGEGVERLEVVVHHRIEEEMQVDAGQRRQGDRPKEGALLQPQQGEQGG